MKRRALRILAVLAIVELALNGAVLLSSREKTVLWDTPVVALGNEDGTTCVVDGNSLNATLLNPDNTIRGNVRHNHFSSISPDWIADIALDRENLYIVDQVLSENGTSIESERVLKYNLDGEYVSTVYTDTEEEREYQGNIRTIRVHDGTLYIVKSTLDSVNVIGVRDGVEEDLIQCAFEGNPIHFTTYQPEIDAITATTMNGKAFISRGGVCREVTLADSCARISDFVVLADGSAYVLDSGNGVLVKQEADGTETEICRTKSVWLSYDCTDGKASKLYLCSKTDDSVTSVSIPDHKTSVSKTFSQPVSYIAKWYLTLTAAVVLAVILLWLVISFIVKKVSSHINLKEAREEETRSGVLSISEVYGRPALYVFTAFIATALLVSSAYYRSVMNFARSNTAAVAASISSLSGETIGDAVSRLGSAEDYGNEDFNNVVKFCSTFCVGERNSGFDLAYDLYKFDSETGETSFIFDYTGFNIMGTKLSRETMEHDGSSAAYADSVFHGHSVTYELSPEYGGYVYLAASPVFDSKGSVVGAILVKNNLDIIRSNIREKIGTTLLRVVTLLAVLLLALVELKLLREFLKLRKKRIAEAGRHITICEGHRPLKLLYGIPTYLLFPFISLYAKDLAAASGLEGNPGLLAALPLSVYGFTMAVSMLFMSIITKKDPARALNVSNVLRLILGGALVLNYLYFKNFYLLVVIFAILGTLSAVANTALKSIRLFDLKPDKRYRKLIFMNMESPIYIATGTAVGALIYDTLGFVPVLAVFALAVVGSIVLTRVFIADDINIKSVKKEHKVKAKRANINYLLRADVIGCMLFAAVAYSMLNPFYSYMLPMFNAGKGFPVLMVGFLTLVTKLLPMFIAPDIIEKMKQKTLSSAFSISLTSMALAAMAFAFRPTMLMFASMLFVFGVFFPVMATLVEMFQVSSAREAGVVASDMNGIFSLCNSVGDFAGPVCIAAMMTLNNKATGFITCGFFLICAVGIYLTFKFRKPSSSKEKA